MEVGGARAHYSSANLSSATTCSPVVNFSVRVSRLSETRGAAHAARRTLLFGRLCTHARTRGVLVAALLRVGVSFSFSGSARGLPGDGGLRWGVPVGGALRYWELLQPHSYWGAVGDRRQNGELEKARLLSIGTNA